MEVYIQVKTLTLHIWKLSKGNKNVTIIASVLTLGVSGAVCDFGVVSIGTTALAMIVGIILNLLLKDRT